MTAKTMAHGSRGQLVLCVHNAMAPADDEWFAYLETLRKLLARGPITQLVMTIGGGPSSAQRKALNEVVGDKNNKVAVATGSSAVRGIVTAISWFNSKIRAFAPDRLEDALKYLEVTPGEMQSILAEVKILHAKVGAENIRVFMQAL